MRNITISTVIAIAIGVAGCGRDSSEQRDAIASLDACKELLDRGLMKVPDDRADRFTGQVSAEAARCRGGQIAVDSTQNDRPWVDWPHYWGAGDDRSRSKR